MANGVGLCVWVKNMSVCVKQRKNIMIEPRELSEYSMIWWHVDPWQFPNVTAPASECARVCVCVYCGYLKLPEDAACVSMIVLSQRDVLYSCPVPLQVALHVFKEPGLEVQADSINLNN